MRDYSLLDITAINHLLLAELQGIEIAVDMTVGNGHDTVFLAQHFPVVYGFDIQEAAIAQAQKIPALAKARLICDDHCNLANYLAAADLFVFNLGWLPHSDKTITTSAKCSLKALTSCKNLLRPGGVISIICYSGNQRQAQEKAAINAWIDNHCEFLTQTVMIHNQPKAPQLYLLSLKKT